MYHTILFSLQSYLKTLKKKQREVTEKYEKADDEKSPGNQSAPEKPSLKASHHPTKKNSKPEGMKPTSFSDDSDLASLARELEEEEHFQESPFIRKVAWSDIFIALLLIKHFVDIMAFLFCIYFQMNFF